MRKQIILTAVLTLLLAAAGCETFRASITAPKSTKKYRGKTYRDIQIRKLALMINDSLRRPSLKNKEIGILSFANLNNLEEVEPLGRHLQERLSHAMFEIGFRIIEIRLGADIRFEPLTGELNLTRIKEKLKRSQFPEIQALVMGNYQDAGDYVYVHSVMVELQNSTVRASGEIKIRKGKYLSTLMNLEDDPEFSSKRTDVFERFPGKPRKNK